MSTIYCSDCGFPFADPTPTLPPPKLCIPCAERKRADQDQKVVLEGAAAPEAIQEPEQPDPADIAMLHAQAAMLPQYAVPAPLGGLYISEAARVLLAELVGHRLNMDRAMETQIAAGTLPVGYEGGPMMVAVRRMSVEDRETLRGIHAVLYREETPASEQPTLPGVIGGNGNA